MTKLYRNLRLAGLLISVVISFAAESTRGQIFVVEDEQPSDVGEYSLSGAPIHPGLIPVQEFAFGVTVSGDSLFITNYFQGTVAAYTTTGGTINSALISGLDHPDGIATSNGNLFVVNNGTGTIGEYTQSGAPVNTALITGLSSPGSIAISGLNLFVMTNDGTVQEYTTTGQLVNSALVTGLNPSNALAVDGPFLFAMNGTFDGTNQTIGKYSILTGLPINPSLISGLDFVQQIAISNGNLFVTYNRSIGEWSESGTVVNANLVSNLGNPDAIVVVPEPSTFVLLIIAAIGGTWSRLCRRGWL